jgi:hypothetical protein
MPGWGKLVAGALIGVAGTVYATNEELRKKLPKGARDLPVALRRRFETAVAAGREASSDRRAEILRALEEHEAEERARSTVPAPRDDTPTAPPVAAPNLKPDASGDVEKGYVGGEPTYPDQDATRPLKRVDEK